MERSGLLTASLFAYRKGLCTSDALLCVSHTLKNAFGSRQKARIVQIDFSTALIGSTIREFSIMSVVCGYFRFCFVYIDTIFIKLTQFLPKLVNVVLGVPHGGFLGPLLFLLYTSECFRGLSCPFWSNLLRCGA